MRINNNLSAINTYNQLSKNTAAANKSMQKLSSGLRINGAADDAAGLSISEKMRSQIRGLDQASRNAQDGISFIQTAEGALGEVSDMLQRMKELAVQHANGSYSTEDKNNIEAEFDQLSQQMSDITGADIGGKTSAAETKFNGITVFTTGTTVAMGEDGKTTLSVAAATFTDLASVDVTDVTTIEDAIDEVNTQRATYGAQQNRLDHAVRNMTTTQENITAAESRIRDVDMAKEMMEFNKNNILAQAAQSMLAQANQQPQQVLQLLRG